MAVCGPIENLSYLPIDYVSLIVAFGGDVEGLPVWFEIDDPNSSCLFDQNLTWNDWGVFGESHKPVMVGDKWYRSNAVGASGAIMNASAWVNSGIKAISKSAFQRIQEQSEPTLE